MGRKKLYQMTYKIKSGILNEETPSDEKTNGLDERPDSDFEQISSWIKHYSLNEWMADLYLKKGGLPKGNRFPWWVKLNPEDLDELKSLVFQGFVITDRHSEIDTQKEYDLNFIKKAKKIIEDGFDVFYSNWW